ncbi:hypothetical protein ACTFIU_009053 [Dictyostelium citrinum]
MVSKDGFNPVLDKVVAITNLPDPTTIMELLSFLGSFNYLRFIPNYTDITSRLATLTGSKTTRITITDEMKEDIRKLKEATLGQVALSFKMMVAATSDQFFTIVAGSTNTKRTIPPRIGNF